MYGVINHYNSIAIIFIEGFADGLFSHNMEAFVIEYTEKKMTELHTIWLKFW
jgi:hypothetical protein